MYAGEPRAYASKEPAADSLPMDTSCGSDSSAENAKKVESAKKVDNADDSSTKKTEGSENPGTKLKYIGMTPGRRRSLQNGRRRRSSTFSRGRRRSSFSSSMFQNRDENNPAGKELIALVMLSLLTILAFVSLIDLDPIYIITWLKWLEEDTMRGILVLLAALMLAIPFFLPITKNCLRHPRLLLWFSGRLDFINGWCYPRFFPHFFIGRFLCTCIHDYINYRAETLIGRRKWIIIQKLLLRDGIYCKFSLKSINKLNIMRILTQKVCSLPRLFRYIRFALHASAFQPTMLYLGDNMCSKYSLCNRYTAQSPDIFNTHICGIWITYAWPIYNFGSFASI